MQKTRAQNDLRHMRRPVSTSVVRCLDSILLKIKAYWLVSILYENPEDIFFSRDEPHLLPKTIMAIASREYNKPLH